MDTAAILAMLAMVMSASTPEEKEKLLNEMKAQLEANAGGSAAPPSTDAPPMAAAPAPPVPDDKNAPPPAAKPLEEQGYAKAIDVLIAARPDLSKEQRAYAKACTSLDTAATYLITIPLAKATPGPVAPAAKPLDAAPRGNGNPTTHRLGKTDNESLSAVAKAMGQPVEKKMGPTVLTKGKTENSPKFFTLGNLTPTEYRAKRATGWDPTKEFPRANEVMQ
jgi:hypothetical protein